MKTMLPDDQWNEGTIADFDDGSIQVNRDALRNVDTMRRIQMLLAQRGPQKVSISFTQQGRPVWMSPGSVLHAVLLEANAKTFRLDQAGRTHVVDYYWEEIEWMQFDSPLPSVI